LDNLGVESGGAKLLRYVFGGGFVFGRASDVGRLGKNAEVLFGELGSGTAMNFSSSFRSAGTSRNPLIDQLSGWSLFLSFLSLFFPL